MGVQHLVQVSQLAIVFRLYEFQSSCAQIFGQIFRRKRGYRPCGSKERLLRPRCRPYPNEECLGRMLSLPLKQAHTH
jgi:hypothetical protein